MAKKNIKTPMKIRAGEYFYDFVSLEDVYNKCLEDRTYFDRLEEAVLVAKEASTDAAKRTAKPQAKKQLAAVLLSEHQVLPNKCFDALYDLLIDEQYCKIARRCIQEELSWDQMMEKFPPKGKPRGPCSWPDCPDDKT